MPCVIMLSVVMLSVIMLIVIMLNVVMLRGVARRGITCRNLEVFLQQIILFLQRIDNRIRQHPYEKLTIELSQ
jgi:hypothetical protein